MVDRSLVDIGGQHPVDLVGRLDRGEWSGIIARHAGRQFGDHFRGRNRQSRHRQEVSTIHVIIQLPDTQYPFVCGHDISRRAPFTGFYQTRAARSLSPVVMAVNLCRPWKCQRRHDQIRRPNRRSDRAGMGMAAMSVSKDTEQATARRRCAWWSSGRCHGDQDCRCVPAQEEQCPHPVTAAADERSAESAIRCVHRGQQTGTYHPDLVRGGQQERC